MTNTEYIRNSLLEHCGLIPRKILPDLNSLRTTEWSAQFEQLMRNRLVMGGIRYGLLHSANKPQYDRIASVIKRVTEYKATGNMELLVDAANLCLLEFEEGNHPNRHFKAKDDAEHVEKR